MALPPTVRVKLSSEAAGSISLTPVVVQELAIRDLVENILGVTGKDEARVRDLLRRGSLVSGASRFRWQGWEPDPADLRELLAAFPDPDPTRAFAAGQCLRAILRGGLRVIDLPREAAARKGLFQRASFWDVLMDVAADGVAGYAGYSYRERADRYVKELSHNDVVRIRIAGESVTYSTVREQIRTIAFSQVELFASRL
jgi:hypothetical protein